MFGLSHKASVIEGPSPSKDAEKLIFCVFDEAGRLRHHFRSTREPQRHGSAFELLENPEQAAENVILREAFKLREPFDVTFTLAGDRRSILHVLPYVYKHNEWRFACVQFCRACCGPDGVDPGAMCAESDTRCFLMLADRHAVIRSVSARIPQSLGYENESLTGRNLQDLFPEPDMRAISACSPDTNQFDIRCAIKGLVSGRRNVKVKKFSAPDRGTLLMICDIAPHQRSEEDVAQIGMRERRRIGQDLHDSVGQMLTGISLLSRSLSNQLKTDGYAGEVDAAQICALADDASNQIRQISRGLIPTEIIQTGLNTSLKELASKTTKSCGVNCQAAVDEAVQFAAGAVETHLYRIAQEAVNNAVRHAGATDVQIVVSRVNGLPQLEVIDNGHWKEPKGEGFGIGMRTMKYRASVIGAQLRADHSSGTGTRVTCRLEPEDALATKG